jgi:hypothetical protein
MESDSRKVDFITKRSRLITQENEQKFENFAQREIDLPAESISQEQSPLRNASSRDEHEHLN